MKHTCHSKWCPNSRTNAHCTSLSGGNTGVYSPMKTAIKVPNVILR